MDWEYKTPILPARVSLNKIVSNRYDLLSAHWMNEFVVDFSDKTMLMSTIREQKNKISVLLESSVIIIYINYVKLIRITIVKKWETV